MSDFHTSHRIVAASEINYSAEAGLVQQRAARGEPGVVRLGPIVFFSTATRDAWMIDVKDGEAACLALGGEARPIPIVENESKLGVAWQARHRLDGETFTVIENDGSARTHLGYPVAEIRRLIADYPAEFSGVRAVDASAARERLRQAGRNDPCPCGSGRKYKKCCRPLDEAALAGANQEVRRTEMQAESSLPEPNDAGTADEFRTSGFTDEPEPASAGNAVSDADEPELAPEVCAAADRIWGEFDRLKQPTPAQLDALLDQLLALSPEATAWHEVLDLFAEKGHSDLPAVFRRIAAVLPPTKAAGASYFYWNAIEKFVSRGHDELVPEIATGFRRLGRESYDADALKHMVFWAMAAGRDADALALEEHFLPMMHVAREAWRFAARPPGGAFRGLWLLVDAVYDEREDRRRRKKSPPGNLLDCLQPRGMERRIASGTRDVLGTNTPHAHILIEAHADLLRFAARRNLISEAEAVKGETGIAMLRGKLGFVARRKESRA